MYFRVNLEQDSSVLLLGVVFGIKQGFSKNFISELKIAKNNACYCGIGNEYYNSFWWQFELAYYLFLTSLLDLKFKRNKASN